MLQSYNSFRSALIALLILCAGSARAERVTLVGEVVALPALAAPVVGTCLPLPAAAPAHPSCTDISNGADPGAMVVPVYGSVKVVDFTCIGTDDGQIIGDDAMNHCVAWVTDSDQTPECFPVADVSMIRDDGGVVNQIFGINQATTALQFPSGGAVMLMLTGYTDIAPANNSAFVIRCQAELEVSR